MLRYQENNELRTQIAELGTLLEQQQTDVVESLELSNNIKKLQKLLDDCLSPREKEIIVYRYGLGGRQEITQSEIGAKLGISRSYVSRIEKKALGKLRQYF